MKHHVGATAFAVAVLAVLITGSLMVITACSGENGAASRPSEMWSMEVTFEIDNDDSRLTDRFALHEVLWNGEKHTYEARWRGCETSVAAIETCEETDASCRFLGGVNAEQGHFELSCSAPASKFGAEERVVTTSEPKCGDEDNTASRIVFCSRLVDHNSAIVTGGSGTTYPDGTELRATWRIEKLTQR
jgi:hypothetical protein